MRTKKDVVVVVGCILFLLATLGTIGDSGRRRAKEMVCLSNLRQWYDVFMMFANDNGGYFMGGRNTGENWWQVLEPYYVDRNLLLCPMATSLMKTGEPVFNYGTWGPAWFPDGFYGSYGINEWISNPVYQSGQTPMYGDGRKYWRTPNVAGADKIPLLADAWWDQAWAESFDTIPDYPGMWDVAGTGDDTGHFCVARHDNAINGVFLDGSAKRIELQCLWYLDWNRLSDTEDAPAYEDFPNWLKELPECNLDLE